MLKVLIVDDESIIREGIKKSIDWESLGFRIVGEAEDGEEALGQINLLSPDIIITDIEMPFLDGIQLQKKLSDKSAPVYTIVISGYSNFSYAQAMMNNGAFAYLLKPVDEDELIKVLGHIKSDYELHLKNSIELGEMQKQVQRSKRHSIQYCMYMLINGICTPQEMREYLVPIGIDSGELYYGISHIKTDDAQKLCEAFSQTRSLFKLCISSRMDICEAGRMGEYILFAWNAAKADLESELKRAAGMILQKFAGAEVSRYSVCRGAENIPALIREMEDLVRRRSETESTIFQGTGRELYELAEQVVFESEASLESTFERIEAELKNKKLDSGEIQFLASSIIYRVFNMLMRSDIDPDEVIGMSPGDMVSTVTSEPNEKWLARLKVMLMEVRSAIDRTQQNSLTAITKAAKKYIDEHYEDEQLDLYMVAQHVHLSISYFSVLFKRIEGVSFKEYLNSVRLEKAKELLCASNYRTYEIAIMVGYSNPTYFSTVFKKQYGESPSEYRKSRLEA